MKERPIIMSGDNPRLIIEGKKTQTRRIGKIQNPAWTELGVEYLLHATKGEEAVATYLAYPKRGTARHGICACPYGIAGDRLWVKERFCCNMERTYYATDFDGTVKVSLTAARFMSRERSRITLEILNVRVERLQDISYDDIICEGWDVQSSEPFKWYHQLWDSLHGKGAWDKNPWVWVIEFQNLTRENKI